MARLELATDELWINLTNHLDFIVYNRASADTCSMFMKAFE